MMLKHAKEDLELTHTLVRRHRCSVPAVDADDLNRA